MKFNGQTPEIILETGIRAIIGKGCMNQEMLNTM